MKMQKKLVQLIQLKLKMEGLFGYNTDYIGFLTSIDGFDFKRATILGVVVEHLKLLLLH